ncbi:MAG TPA: glucose-6-phosphate dehydrogenase assembly protein OpcA [Opitutaceae bacterium]|nr:glucose-6-phosphate dehydrogenase assembly protein OpcA [Opitutaceae bacterium]
MNRGPVSVFDALPGIEVPVGGMRRALERIWESDAPPGAGAPSEFRAAQLNLVLHLGLPTSAAEAVAQFELALRFAQAHPCRAITLVPLADAPAGSPMRAKLYSQCYLGGSRGDMSCTEALVLAYPQETRGFVSDQVSTLIDPDLPLYYWAHRFSACRKIADYQYLLRAARRFVFDSALVPEEALTFPWPRPEAVRDLAAARLLHVRQLLGQHLAGIEPARLVDGLERVVVRATPGLRQEGRALLAWALAALRRCGETAAPATGMQAPIGPETPPVLELEFGYNGGCYFRWRADFAMGAAGFDSDLGGGRQLHCAPVKLASPEIALGEALLF